ncbi:Protein root UVB sensitive 6 [Camellia lanceoleosa]|uniref:Protein root UVB sensitive 6 n=1 Tax=Camellia lanceoleosa TaxID=1840588 RepID=A0ACC0GYG2_9ERIC|nr:Protein root UVB sensitive 6 [Camellia lanceoleosa]
MENIFSFPWSKDSPIVLGPRFKDAFQDPNSYLAIEPIFEKERYIVTYNPSKGNIYALLKDQAKSDDILKAAFHAHVLLHIIHSSNQNQPPYRKHRETDHSVFMRSITDLQSHIAESCKMVSALYGPFKSKATKQSSYPVRVWEDQDVVPSTFNLCGCCKKHQPKHQPVEEEHSSVKLRGTEEKEESNEAGDGEPSQNHIVESTQHFYGESPQQLEYCKIEARGQQTRKNADGIGAQRKCDTEVAETCSKVGNLPQAEACRDTTAESGTFLDSKAADQGHDGQICTPGFMRSLSGSILNRTGLRLEVVLGHNKFNSEWGGLNEIQCGSELGGLNEIQYGPVLSNTHANDFAEDAGLALRESNESISSHTQMVSMKHKSEDPKHKGKAKEKGKEKMSFVRPTKGLLHMEKRSEVKGVLTSIAAQNMEGASTSISNKMKSTNNNGKRKVGVTNSISMGGFSGFARRLGHGGAGSSKVSHKGVVVRAPAAAMLMSAPEKSQHSCSGGKFHDAQLTLNLGKRLGVDCLGQDAAVIQKLVRMEEVDKARIGEEVEGAT